MSTNRIDSSPLFSFPLTLDVVPPIHMTRGFAKSAAVALAWVDASTNLLTTTRGPATSAAVAAPFCFSGCLLLSPIVTFTDPSIFRVAGPPALVDHRHFELRSTTRRVPRNNSRPLHIPSYSMTRGCSHICLLSLTSTHPRTTLDMARLKRTR